MRKKKITLLEYKQTRKLSVLVCLGFYNKIPQTGVLNNRNVFFIVLQAGTSKVMVSVSLIHGEGYLPGLQMAVFFLCPHIPEREEVLVSILFIKTLISSWGSTLMSLSKPNYLPKLSLPYSVILEIMSSKYKFGGQGGHRDSVHNSI